MTRIGVASVNTNASQPPTAWAHSNQGHCDRLLPADPAFPVADFCNKINA